MKKTLLIAVALCCMMPVMAQKFQKALSLKDRVTKVEQLTRQNTIYTHKLDSMVMDEGLMTMAFRYDNHFNRTKMTMTMLGQVYITVTYQYDGQNRLVRATQVDYDGTTTKIDYSYNNQDKVAQETYYEMNENEGWDPYYRAVYEYSNGNRTKTTEQFYDDAGTWTDYSLHTYLYTNGKLVEDMGYYMDYETDVWDPANKEVYTYNNAGDCTTSMFYDLYDGDWHCTDKTTYEFDSQHNCTKQTSYDIDQDTGDELLNDVINYRFDLTVPSSIIAGLGDLLDDELITIHNKLISVQETTYDDGEEDETSNYVLYYSAGTNVSEQDGTLLNIWPNPVSETLNLSGEMMQVSIFSVDGREVMQLNKDFESINVSTLAPGSYLLKATLKDGNVATQKFLKQ